MPNLDDSPIRDAEIDEAPIVAVLEYSSQQAQAIADALSSSGADVYVTSNWAMCTAADGLIVPGADSDFDIQTALLAVKAAEMIDARLLANRPVLVVGNAFNALFESRDEGKLTSNSMIQWPGNSEQVVERDSTGWLSVDAADESKLLREIEDENFAFENSHAIFEWMLHAQGPLHAPRVSWTKTEPRFLAAVENGPLVATQFRPEISNAAGKQLLINWVASL